MTNIRKILNYIIFNLIETIKTIIDFCFVKKKFI
jgi:hypothetical protein